MIQRGVSALRGTAPGGPQTPVRVRCSPPCDNRAAKTAHVMRAYRDGMRFAAQLVRDFDGEHNEQYRARLARFIETEASK